MLLRPDDFTALRRDIDIRLGSKENSSSAQDDSGSGESATGRDDGDDLPDAIL
jgi:hypothetical protein